MKLPMNFEEMIFSLNDAIKDKSPDELRVLVDKKGTEQHILSRYFTRMAYAGGCRYVQEAGIIGVGIITFRDERIARMSRLIKRMCKGEFE